MLAADSPESVEPNVPGVARATVRNAAGRIVYGVGGVLLGFAFGDSWPRISWSQQCGDHYPETDIAYQPAWRVFSCCAAAGCTAVTVIRVIVVR